VSRFERGRRLVEAILGLLASSHSIEDVLKAWPCLEEDDILASLSRAAWRTHEVEIRCCTRT